MRFDLHKVRTYLVNQLNEAVETVAEVQHDGTDLILVRLTSGETVIIYLIDRLMPIYEIRDTLTENTAADRHTLLVLWSDLLLPEENRLHVPEDWMEVLLTIYNGKIYGYDSYGPYASVFPVYFHKQEVGLDYFVTYGEAINAADLRGDYVHVDVRDVKGFWRVADFAANAPEAEAGAHQQRVRLDTRRNSLAVYLAILELPADADRRAVRKAYYRLARRYHPDVNDSPEATHRMQQINEAYRRIMAQFEQVG